jgi:hypothetical protein
MRGSNHVGMRQFNERIVLQAVRHHGALPKAELARITHLSSQTVAIIVGRLLEDGLLCKQDRVRGKIGQPSVPLALHPQGAFSIGIQVGRRSLQIVVADFCGQVVQRIDTRYAHPDPAQVLPAIAQGLAHLETALGAHWARVVGIGLTAPLFLHQWAEVLGGQAAQALARTSALRPSSQTWRTDGAQLAAPCLKASSMNVLANQPHWMSTIGLPVFLATASSATYMAKGCALA